MMVANGPLDVLHIFIQIFATCDQSKQQPKNHGDSICHWERKTSAQSFELFVTEDAVGSIL